MIWVRMNPSNPWKGKLEVASFFECVLSPAKIAIFWTRPPSPFADVIYGWSLRDLFAETKNVSLCKLKQRETINVQTFIVRQFIKSTVLVLIQHQTICSVNSSTYSWGIRWWLFTRHSSSRFSKKTNVFLTTHAIHRISWFFFRR